MNRHLTRTIAKVKLSPKELTSVLHEEGLIATGMAVDGLSTAFAMVLHDNKTPKLSNKAIKRILIAVDAVFGSITEGRITVEDLKETLFDETGIAIQNANAAPTQNK